MQIEAFNVVIQILLGYFGNPINIILTLDYILCPYLLVVIIY